MSRVIFELGWLCCRYTAPELEQKLLIFAETGYNWDKMTGYIPSLFPNMGPVPFRDSYSKLKASELINRRVLHLILRMQAYTRDKKSQTL